MTEPPLTASSMWDPSGDVSRALQSGIDQHGMGSLSSPQVLGNVLRALPAGAGREAEVVLAAAEFDVPGALTRHIQAGLGPDTAVSFTAGGLAEARALDPIGCLWVTSEIGRALGYAVSAGLVPVADSSRPPGPAAKKTNWRSVLAAGLVGALVVYLIVAAAVKTPPFSASSSPTAARPVTLPSGQLPLSTLMPGQSPEGLVAGLDVSECAQVSPVPVGLVGVDDALACGQVPGRSGWELFGYKFDTAASYRTSEVAYVNDKGFDSADAGNVCPPTNGSDEGTTSWGSAFYPARAGQVLDCLDTGNSGSSVDQATYVWSLPSQWAVFEVIAAPGVSLASLQGWWAEDGIPGHQ